MVATPCSEATVRTQPHVVDVDRPADHRGVRREEAFFADQGPREPATPVRAPVRAPARVHGVAGDSRGDLLRREEQAEPTARGKDLPWPTVLPPPELYSRTVEEDVFDASVRFTWFVILAFNIAIVAIIIITFAAAGILSTARVTVAVNGALFTLVTLLALPYVSVMRIHVERVTAAGMKADATNAPFGNEGAGADSDPWRHRRVRLVSHRLPCLYQEEHELRVSDITDITVGDSNQEVDRRKACCHDVVYAHTRATGAIPWRFPVYVGNDADKQAELWLNYLGLPPRGTV